MKSALLKRRLRLALRLAEGRAAPDTTVRSGDPSRRHVFIGLAADYGNLGDLAITYAQRTFLEGQFPDAVVETLPIRKTAGALQRLRSRIGPDDLVTLVGGGNTGDMYDDIQFLRERFLRVLRETPVVSFPQTVDFSTTARGRRAGRRAAAVYRAHPRLGLMARDSRSAEESRRLFEGVPVVTSPDVVLTLDRSEPVAQRQGFLVALRRDGERGLSDIERAQVLSDLSALGDVVERDTHIGDLRLDDESAVAELEDYWAACRNAQVMVTDRLHGMIFAIITGTSCIVLDSGTHKVAQFYRDWLTDLPGVEFLSDLSLGSVRAAVHRTSLSGPPPRNSAPLQELRARFRREFDDVLSQTAAR